MPLYSGRISALIEDQKNNNMIVKTVFMKTSLCLWENDNSKYRGRDRYWIGRLLASFEQIVIDKLANK
jgi:hypothetical protein